MGDELKEGERLSAGELWEELDGTPIAEAVSQVIVPKKGNLFESDGSLRVAIIRPCVSRGKRIRGLPPIYAPKMLAESAGVFTDWPMYEDHLAEGAIENFREQLAEAQMGDLIAWLEERARGIKELGGRVEKSFWNPDITFKDDASMGYRKGGVEGKVFPQPRVAAMLEADPKVLNVSINAWPTGAKAGTAPWDSSVRGMVIEGISPKPRGSVDWVYRGGAGGRLLMEELGDEDGRLAVSVLEAYYSADHKGTGPLAEEDDVKKKLSELKPDELREYLQEEAPHLVEALGAGKAEEPASSKTAPAGGITEEQLTKALNEQKTALESSFESKLSERDTELEEKVEERVAEDRKGRVLSAKAEELISEAERNGFPKVWGADIRRRYTVLPSGPAAGLQIQESDLKVTESDEDGKDKTVTLTELELVEKRVREDVAHCLKLMEAAGASPRVRGFGASKPDPGGEGKRKSKKAARTDNALRSFLREEGILKTPKKDDKDAVSEDDQIAEMFAGEAV